jgi:hypothetical protein
VSDREDRSPGSQEMRRAGEFFSKGTKREKKEKRRNCLLTF